MKKILILLIATVAVIIGIRTYNTYNEFKIVKEISNKIIRFHVRANSDSEEDQRLKLIVRDEVIDYLENKLSVAATLDDAKNILYYCKDEIEQIAENTIFQEGYKYSVRVYFEKTYFPMKTYGDMVFPAGKYEAFRIDIGDSEGRNWWCVLFPPLCFVDSTYAIVPDSTKEQFASRLSKEAYSAITISENDDNYKVRFKYLTFLNKLLKE